MPIMREGWTETTLGEIATFEYGKPLKAENRDGIGFPVFGSAGEVGRHSEPLVDDAPVIVVGRKGTAGAVWWSEIPCSVIDTAYYVVPKMNVNFRYLFLLLEFIDLPSLTAQTGVPGLNRDRAYSSDVNLPQLEEQNRIVDVVSSVDAYIDSLQQQADSARTARNAVLHELLSAGGDDWTETTLGSLISLRTGKLDVNAGVDDGEFPFFTCSRDTYKIDVAAYSGKSVIVAGNGDLNVKYYEGEFNAYQRTYILQTIDESVLNPKFLFHFMDKYLETLRNDTQGSTIQYLKKAQFTEAPIALPPLEEQKQIVEIVSSMEDVIQVTELAIADAKNLRSGMLSDLLSGEHEIPASYDVFVGAS
jgi:restriction endonuclease S subunit